MDYFVKELNELKTLNYFFGGRGCGKTFNFLLKVCRYSIDTGREFIFLRDSEKITQMIAKSGSLTSPIEEVYPDFEKIMIVSGNGLYEFWTYETEIQEGGKVKRIPLQKIGYLAAVSTFHNARGMDFSTVDYILFDEFIPEEGVPTFKGRGDLFLNLYETVNRNRELEGRPACRVIMTTNTNTPFSPYLEIFGVEEIIENMDQNIYEDPDIYIEFISNEAFRNKKSKTFLYRRAKSERFLSMALDNDFTINTALIRKGRRLTGCTPMLQVGDSVHYVLYSCPDDSLYWRRGSNKDVQSFDMSNDQEAMLFRFLFTDKLRRVYVSGGMLFDSIYTLQKILEYAKM